MSNNFHFGPATVHGTRGLDENFRMWIRIDVQSAMRQPAGPFSAWAPSMPMNEKLQHRQ